MSDPITIPAIAADESLYPIEKIEAHRLGVLHQAVSIFVFCGADLLVQRRAVGKYHCGGLWANSCCSHPHWGETLQDCAERRLGEELGVSLPLTQVGGIEYAADVGGGLREHERVAVFHSQADRQTLDIRPDQEEVSEVRWETPRRLHREAAEHPEVFAPWFRIYLERWEELGL